MRSDLSTPAASATWRMLPPFVGRFSLVARLTRPGSPTEKTVRIGNQSCMKIRAIWAGRLARRLYVASEISSKVMDARILLETMLFDSRMEGRERRLKEHLRVRLCGERISPHCATALRVVGHDRATRRNLSRTCSARFGSSLAGHDCSLATRLTESPDLTSKCRPLSQQGWIGLLPIFSTITRLLIDRKTACFSFQRQ